MSFQPTQESLRVWKLLLLLFHSSYSVCEQHSNDKCHKQFLHQIFKFRGRIKRTLLQNFRTHLDCCLLFLVQFLSPWAHKVLFKRSSDMLQAEWRIILSQRGISLPASVFLIPALLLSSSSSSIKRCVVEACGCKETRTRGLFSVAGGGEKYLSTCGFFFLSLSSSSSSPHSLRCAETGWYTIPCLTERMWNELWRMMFGDKMHKKEVDEEKEDILEVTFRVLPSL